jgi:hypothetical protein
MYIETNKPVPLIPILHCSFGFLWRLLTVCRKSELIGKQFNKLLFDNQIWDNN